MPHAVECFRAGQKATWAVAGHVSGQITDILNTGFLWSAFYQLDAYDPDLVILYCMGNEIINGVPAATWKANAGTLIAKLRETATVLLVIEPQLNSANFFTSLHSDYATAATQLAAQYGCSLCDLRPVFLGSYAAANAAGLMYDNLHPNSAGHDLIAAEFAKY
jgi:lysophospholipase L1-like esterase